MKLDKLHKEDGAEALLLVRGDRLVIRAKPGVELLQAVKELDVAYGDICVYYVKILGYMEVKSDEGNVT